MSCYPSYPLFCPPELDDEIMIALSVSKNYHQHRAFMNLKLKLHHMHHTTGDYEDS